MIQTVTTAGAVGVTLLDSSRSGLSAIKPATRALRGAALVPYWTLSGLASQAGLFRNLAFLSLALGGALLVLAVFGALPESLLVPAATIGGGAIVVALAYGAMRSGTMLHGLVLLPTGIVLTSIGIKMMYEQAETHREVALNGAFGAGALVALSLALIVLGSLPGNNRTVIKTLIELVRKPRRLFAGLGRLVLAAAALYGVWRLAILLSGAPWLRALRWAILHQTLVIWIGVVLTVIGAVLAIGLSWWLKLFRRHGDEGRWALLPLADSAGVAAGWAVVYGAGYLAICLALLLRRPEWLTEGQPWIRITVGAAVLAGILLIIIVPVVLPVRSLMALAGREVDRARMAGMPKVEGGKAEELRAAYVDDLAVRANACRGHLKIERGTSPAGTALVLTAAGGRMYRRAVNATRSVRR